MAYKLIKGAVYDGPVYLGIVEPEDGGKASVYTKQHDPRQKGRRIRFPTVLDAVEFLVAEHRDIPWADRPLCQRRGG